MKFTEHVKETVKKANAIQFALYPLLNYKSPLTINTKLYIYKLYTRSVIFYAGPVWTPNLSDNSWKKLKRIQSKLLRSITGKLFST